MLLGGGAAGVLFPPSPYLLLVYVPVMKLHTHIILAVTHSMSDIIAAKGPIFADFSIFHKKLVFHIKVLKDVLDVIFWI